MEILAIGTGAILTSCRSSSFLIDETLMIDCPNGSVKTLRSQGADIAAIECCLITHFHADHYFDVPFLLLELGLRQARENEFTIVGPRGVAKRIRDLFSLAYPEDLESVFERARLRFVEMRDGDRALFSGYEVNARAVCHGSCDALGFTVADGSSVVGFSGDTVDCAGVESIVSAADMAFLDASFVRDTETHMGAFTFLRYVDEFGGEKRLVPTHLSDSSRSFLMERGVCVPADGDVFIV